MGNLLIQERLKIVSDLISQRKELRNALEFHIEILRLQLEIDNTPTKGARRNCGNPPDIVSLQQSSLRTKKPIVHFIDPSIFDQDILLPLSERVARIFVERNIEGEGFKKFLDLTKNGKIDLSKSIEAILREDEYAVKRYAEGFGIKPAMFLYAVSVLVQPYLEEIARKIDSSFSDNWWQTSCPVCGRTPIVARVRDRRRHLLCAFCGTEYLSDRFVCVHCGNKDPYTLKFMASEDQPEFQIDFCTKCNHYVKIIDEEKLKKTIPKGFEDILTLNLDLAAKDASLIRD